MLQNRRTLVRIPAAMTAMTPNLSGHKGLRGDVLLELKRAQPVTAKALADVFGVFTNAVRRHLKELEAEALIVYRREQRGNGAPSVRLSAEPEWRGALPHPVRRSPYRRARVHRPE